MPAKPRVQRSDTPVFPSTLLIWLAFLLASGLRLLDLELKPVHVDEAVIGNFMLQSMTGVLYQYTAEGHYYHGPFLYFLGAAIFHGFGTSTFLLRLPSALAGSVLILLLFPLRRMLGTTGAVWCAFLLALSPALSYFARHAIPESFLILFSLSAISCLVWHRSSGRSLGLSCVAISVALMLCVRSRSCSPLSRLEQRSTLNAW